MISKRLKASTMFYAIVISLLISMILGFLIIYSYHTKILFNTYYNEYSLQKNAESGITLLLADESGVVEKTVDLFNNGRDSVYLKRKYWGMLQCITAIAKNKSKQIKKSALVGNTIYGNKELALYLQNNGKSLFVCGNTKIKGNVFIPNAEIKPAYIEGKSFLGAKMLEGKANASAEKMPKLYKQLEEIISGVLNRQTYSNDSILYISNNNINDSIINTFDSKTIVLYSNESISLSNIFLQGNVVVFSEKKIEVNSSCGIEDILLCAPYIEIKSNFKGSLQAFVKDSIVIQKNIELNYPSFIGLYNSNATISKIKIDENCIVKGGILAYQKTENNIQACLTSIEKNTSIYGSIYSNFYIDFKGILYGNIICNSLILKTPSAVYENHLLDVIIDPSKLSDYFVGVNMIEPKNAKIIKWL